MHESSRELQPGDTGYKRPLNPNHTPVMMNGKLLTEVEIDRLINDVRRRLEAIRRIEATLGSILANTPEETERALRMRWLEM